MLYTITINDEIYAENLSAADLPYTLELLTLSDCINFIPNADYYIIAVIYIDDDEIIDTDIVAEYTENDIDALYRGGYNDFMYHAARDDMIEW